MSAVQLLHQLRTQAQVEQAARFAAALVKAGRK